MAGYFHSERAARSTVGVRSGKETRLGGRDQKGVLGCFKRDAVEILRAPRKPIRHVAGELGIYHSTLGNRVRQDEVNRGEQEWLRELERENARLRMGRELSNELWPSG